jgi:hypothetical protein
MKTLISIKTPGIYDNMFENLFVQVAAKHRCPGPFKVDSNHNVVDADATPVQELKAIENEYQLLRDKIAEQCYNLYIDNLLQYRLYDPEDYCTPLTILLEERKKLKRA